MLPIQVYYIIYGTIKLSKDWNLICTQYQLNSGTVSNRTCKICTKQIKNIHNSYFFYGTLLCYFQQWTSSGYQCWWHKLCKYKIEKKQNIECRYLLVVKQVEYSILRVVSSKNTYCLIYTRDKIVLSCNRHIKYIIKRECITTVCLNSLKVHHCVWIKIRLNNNNNNSSTCRNMLIVSSFFEILISF